MYSDIERDRHKNAIRDSWLRCQYHYSLTRNATYPILRLQSTEIAPRVEALIEKIGGSHGVFQKVIEFTVQAEHCLAVCDVDQVLVRIECKDKGYSKYENHGIALGSCWNEQIAGTNGVTMAMGQGNAVTVRGKDHFFSKLDPFVCTAVPLLDAKNEIIGAANLSAIDKGNIGEYLLQKRFLELAARKIQRHLFEKQFSDSLILSISDPIKNGLFPNDELIAIDGSGSICGYTSKAEYLPLANATASLHGLEIEQFIGVSVENLLKNKAKKQIIQLGNNSTLKVSVQDPNSIYYPGRGWHNETMDQRHILTEKRHPPSLQDLAVGSKKMEEIVEQAQLCFSKSIPCIINGESGTGKSSLVKALHNKYAPSAELLSIDCATYNQSMQKELDKFSYGTELICLEQSRQQVKESSVTLLLDNISELPDYGQAKLRSLLKTIESDDLVEKSENSSIRVIATSRDDLFIAVQEARFREDIYYLLCGARFTLPPLRERQGLIKLSQIMVEQIAGRKIVLTHEIVKALQQHNWPGNVRELRNVLRQYLIAGKCGQHSLEEISRYSPLLFGSSDTGLQAADNLRSPEYTEDEKTDLLNALEASNWNVAQAAQILSVSRSTIYRKMNLYQINRPLSE